MPDYYYREVNVRFGPGGISPMVRNLLIANAVVYFVQVASGWFHIQPGLIENWLALSPSLVFRGRVWQIFTYMFLHAEPMHILFNMFFLWMFGVDVERSLGSRRFAAMYFISGLGAGLLTCAFPPFWHAIVLGASGAVFGVMVAFGLLFPDRMILLFFILPVKALYMVIFVVGLEVLYMTTYMHGGGVAHVTHVAGALCGYLYLRFGMKSAGRAKPDMRARIQSKLNERQAASEAEAQKKVDEILDKINREGLHKLSRSERAFLKQRSERKKH